LAIASLVCGAGGAFVSCRAKQEAEKPTDNEVLMQVGDSVLTRKMVTSLIPPGLNASDSIRMFDALVEAWVERNMLVTLAGSQLPDIEKIERMVEQYREQLLANEYRRLMANDHVHGVSAAAVSDYYTSHPEMFILKRPLVKGIYLKVKSDAPRVDELRGWLRSASDADIDNLESYGLHDAMEYDYFGDTWVDWQAIADHIPYRFNDPDAFVSGNEFFEWTANGSIFMLRVLDHIKSGNQTPLEFAETEIRELLMEQGRGDYDRKLLSDMYANGISSKAIRPGAYVPLKYRRAVNNENHPNNNQSNR